MKFMKLGTRPDTFYEEEASRKLISDVPSDITIRINQSTSYHLHKYPLLPKCGLLQRLSFKSDESTAKITLDLDDVPGGSKAFELCAKFCYGITINFSAHNFAPTFCAAKFLQMTEAVEKGNFVMKLEAFFSSSILEGWKDSIVALDGTYKVYKWSENLGIVRRCIKSIVNKILTPPPKVMWSYTYTRAGYGKKHHQPAPKDWWTEDISCLDIDMFRCIIAAIKSTNALQPQLVGEALHVYAYRWLPDLTGSRVNEGSSSQAPDSLVREQKILETIVSLIPADKRSVSMKFLLRLLSTANSLAVSQMTIMELLRISSLQLDEAMPNDLLLPVRSPNENSHDIDLVKTVFESYLSQWRRQTPEENQSLESIVKVGRLLDLFLQVAAKDVNMPAQKFVNLIGILPGTSRPNHDDLYKAMNIYLEEHPNLSKKEKKDLCRLLDCQKLSPEIRSHAVRNEHLPLRTVVQVLYFDQEKGSLNTKHIPEEQLRSKQQDSVIKGDHISRYSKASTSVVSDNLRKP